MAFRKLFLEASNRRVSRNDLCEGVGKGREHVEWPQGSQGLCGWKVDGAKG